MTSENQLVEDHIREYEARLKHIDELFARASQVENQTPEHQAELSDLKQERAKLTEQMAQIKQLSAEEWAKKGGPMVIWDLVAQRLEKLLERLE